ncbi:MAG: hypothetical protein GXP63_02025 [DPANN group archaeon]|nr:hypothetical protein [DPANN group archaeon]
MLQKDNRMKVLELFFIDPMPESGGYQLREMSRMIPLAPVSLKNYLSELEKEDLIKKTLHRVQQYPLYSANRDSSYFKTLKKLHSIRAIEESGLLDVIDSSCMPNTIVLFGSVARGEDIKESDIDLFVEADQEHLVLKRFEKILQRRINLLFSTSFRGLSNELKNNIINGIVLKGYLKGY